MRIGLLSHDRRVPRARSRPDSAAPSVSDVFKGRNSSTIAVDGGRTRVLGPSLAGRGLGFTPHRAAGNPSLEVESFCRAHSDISQPERNSLSHQ